MLRPFLADLHIHTVLSACAEVEMIPPLIVRRACRLGLGIIAVTDHNACANAEAVIRAADGTGLAVLPGMELQTREEVHLLCLFDTVEQCGQWQEEVWRALPPLANREEFFGPQYVVDAEGEWVRTEERLLAASADIGLERAVARVHALGGLAIPAHVDRPSFSLLANLGMVPANLGADALEVTARFQPEAGFSQWPELRAWPLVVNGDAHRLSEIRNRTLFKVAAPTVYELSLALRGVEGRKVAVDWHPTQS
ncbi:MAG: PHP domain-containing protein [Chloroflexi bacterium]|nr:PHP domain-containing protein [Chloroflexota bacterium]